MMLMILRWAMAALSQTNKIKGTSNHHQHSIGKMQKGPKSKEMNLLSQNQITRWIAARRLES